VILKKVICHLAACSSLRTLRATLIIDRYDPVLADIRICFERCPVTSALVSASPGGCLFWDIWSRALLNA
jgi:hypothetical protein